MPEHNSRRVILASMSPRRKELLALIRTRFEIIPSEFDESKMPDDMPPSEFVVLSAKEKARDVAAGVSDGIIIGADTVVSIDEHILGKPVDEDDAKRMLRLLSSNTHQVYTGVHVIDVRPECTVERSDYVCTDVKFRMLSEELVERYVATREPMDKAGAYAIQGRGSILVESISGCFFNVVGLPVYKLSKILEELGMEMLCE